MSSVWIIIDFGESTFKAYFASKEKAEILYISNNKENATKISFHGKQRNFGLLAASLTEHNFEQSIYNAKTAIGSNKTLMTIQNWEIFDGKKNDRLNAELSSVDILSYFLGFLAEKATNSKFNNMLYIMPSYYLTSHEQQQCVKDAAEIANIKNFQMIDSHEALVYDFIVKYYNIDSPVGNNFHMFADGGDSYFDIFIVNITKDEIQELCSFSIDFGGKDLTISLFNYYLNKFKKSDDVSVTKLIKNIEANKRLQRIFYNACQKTKENIASTSAKMPFAGKDLFTECDLKLICRSDDLEGNDEMQFYIEHFQDFLDDVNSFLDENKLLDKIIGCECVGCNTIPSFIKDMLTNTFDGIQMTTYLSPLQAFSEGAAFYIKSILNNDPIPTYTINQPRSVVKIERPTETNVNYPIIMKREIINYDYYTKNLSKSKSIYKKLDINDNNKIQLSSIKNDLQGYYLSAKRTMEKLKIPIDVSSLVSSTKNFYEMYENSDDLCTIQKEWKDVTTKTNTMIQKYILSRNFDSTATPRDKLNYAITIDNSVRQLPTKDTEKTARKYFLKQMVEQDNKKKRNTYKKNQEKKKKQYPFLPVT